MKVLLINPLVKLVEKDRAPATISPPLGLLFIASYLRQYDDSIEIKVYDFDVKQMPYSEQGRIIERESPDIVGVGATTLSINGALKLAEIVKSIDKKILTVLGGTHLTALPNQDYINFDVKVIGEGEQAFVDIVSHFDKENKVPTQIGPLNLISSLNFMPAYDLIDIREYVGHSPKKHQQQTVVLWSRGCIFDCLFCSNCVWKQSRPRVRYRSPEHIVYELEYLNQKYGIKEFFVYDDEINNSPSWIMRVCDAIIERGLDIVWKTQARVNAPLTPPEMFPKLAKSGCWVILWGIESVNDRVLKGIKKYNTTQEVLRALKLSKEAGIDNFGFFMGFSIWEENGTLEYETVEEVRKTIRFAVNLRKRDLLDYIQFTITTPYPGSELYKIASKYNLIAEPDFSKWDTHVTVLKTPAANIGTIQQIHNEAWRAFTLDPKYLLKMGLRLHYKEYLRAAKTLYRYIWKKEEKI